MTNKMHSYYKEWWENSRDPRTMLFRRFTELVSLNIPVSTGGLALDVGAGKGAIVAVLHEHGYRVQGIECNPNFYSELRKRFPFSTVYNAMVQDFTPDEQYDLCTMVQVLQNIPTSDIIPILRKLAPYCKRFVLGVTNSRSFHGYWTKLRGFSPEFIYPMAVQELISKCEECGLVIKSCKGIGLVSQVTLLRDFRWPVVPRSIEHFVNQFESLFPMYCHLCCISLVSSVYEA